MQVTAWNNGSTGYGFQLSKNDRDKYINKNWKSIILSLPFQDGIKETECNICKESFWDRCPELIDKEIKFFLVERNLTTWEKRNPPKFEMIQVKENHFKILL